MRQKLYIVKYEVKATSLRRALNTRGELCEIFCTDKKEWPEEKTKETGFKLKK